MIKRFFSIVLFLCFLVADASNKYIISGGGCVGKSTLIECLKKRGFQVAPEIFHAMYNEAKERGEAQKFMERTVARDEMIVRRQIASENALDPLQPAFLDRSALEWIYFAEYYSLPCAPEVREMIQQQEYGDVVFFPDPLPECYYAQAETRRSTREIALRKHALLESFYVKQGFTIIRVPFGTVEQRADFILRHVRMLQVALPQRC